MTKTPAISSEALHLIEALPDLYLILSTDFTILGASEVYHKATQLKPEEIKGRNVFEVFPDNPALPKPEGVQDLRNSLEWVLQHKQVHEVTIRYDVQLPPETGHFQEKYWIATNTPVLDNQGKVQYILHKALDITEQMLAKERLKQNEHELEVLYGEQQIAKSELVAARVEAELERNKLHNFFMQAPAMICILEGPQHIFSFVNPPYQQLVGKRPLLGRAILEAMPELEGQAVIGMLRKAYDTGETLYAHEVKVSLDHTNDGHMGNNYYNFIYQAIRNVSGEIEALMVFAYEVTAQVAARQELEVANIALAQSQQDLRHMNQELELRIADRTRELELSKAAIEAQRNRLYTVFMNSPIPVLVMDGPKHAIEMTNPAFESAFPVKNGLGKPLFEVFPELVGTPLQDIVEQVYQTGEPYTGTEYPVSLSRRDDGKLEEFYFTFTYQARRNEQGEIDGLLLFFYEVTELVKSRKKAERNAERIRLITDALPVLIGYLDKEERYRFTNRAYEAWFPVKASDLLGKTVREVVGEKAYSGVKQYIDRALAGERLDFQSRMPYREDFVKYIQTSYVPDIKDGETVGFYTLVHDITEQTQARLLLEASEQDARALTEKLATTNQELFSTNTQLRHINVDLDNFIYAASHDLKAPIYNIERLLLILLESIPDEVKQLPETQQVVGMIDSSITRFKRTIDHLTDVTKLQKENNQEASEIDLRALIREVELDLSAQIESSGATVELQVDDCRPIRFPEKNLRSVIYNLLSNAIKYSDPERPPQVRISCRTTDEHTVLQVKDNGLGMSPGGLQKIFSMFTRLHDHVEGDGIGLYMVKKIVENAGGRIEVESELGQGSTFSIYFKR